MGWQGRGTFAMPFSPLAKTVRHDSVRLQRGPSEPALEQLELLKRQDLRNRDRDGDEDPPKKEKCRSRGLW